MAWLAGVKGVRGRRKAPPQRPRRDKAHLTGMGLAFKFTYYFYSDMLVFIFECIYLKNYFFIRVILTKSLQYLSL